MNPFLPALAGRPAQTSTAAPIVVLARAIARYLDAGASGYNTRFPLAAPERFLVEMQKDFRRQQGAMIAGWTRG